MTEINKIDKRILVLQSLGIIFVVLGHTGDAFPIFSSWFAYDSFHMPLFIFISGYLYKERQNESTFAYIWRKFKHLIIAFYGWLLVYGLVTNCLLYKGWIYYGSEMNLQNFLIFPWTYGCKYSFTAAWWFIPALFLCQVVNRLFRKILLITDNLIKDIVMQSALLFSGILLSEYARSVGGMYGGIMTQFQMTIIKVGFLLPFFQMGYIFKHYIGEIIDRIRGFVFYAMVICVQFAVLLLSSGGTGLSTVHLWFGSRAILVYIGAMNGIIFWFRISYDLLPILNDNKQIAYIGKNTWTVLIHHQIVIWLVGVGIYYISKISSLFQDINVKELFGKYWYVYSFQGDVRFNILYVIAGISIPLVIKLVIDNV